MLLSSAVAMKLDVEALNDLDVVVAKQPAVIQPTEVDVSSADSVLPLPLPSDALLPGGGAQLDSAALLPFDRLPMYSLTHGQVMTEEQLEILRRQISAYATICQQLVELHKAIMVQQTTLTGVRAGQSVPYDPIMNSIGHKLTSRQRWTPSQTQLQI
eukprot:c25757_g1_i2 orf=3-470(-)